MNDAAAPPLRRPATWALVLAFALVSRSWGTTYLAMKEGVRTLPPALFGGVRITLAGLIILSFLVFRGDPLRLPLRELAWMALAGVFLFVLGNGLISVGQKTIESSAASV